MDLGLDGKVALVTGASRGIGKAIATELADSGARVMLTSRKQDALEETAKEISETTRAAATSLAAHAANAGEPDQIAPCVAATVEQFGRIDVLVNNAGTNPYLGPAIDVDLPRFDKTWQVNYRGPVVWAQEVWRASMQEHGGVMLNISSIGGLTVEPFLGHYNVTKAALVHLTKTLALELAPNVRVNAIAPGLVKTDLARALWESDEAGVASHMPLRRLGEPVDIANAAAFLVSDAASWITGETLVVDGGALLRGSIT